MCECGIFSGGYLQNLQYTRLDLKITLFSRGLNEKEPGPSSSSGRRSGELRASAAPAEIGAVRRPRDQAGSAGGRGERGELG